jgi:menaquinone-dependent protoporphyrinogen oxidase
MVRALVAFATRHGSTGEIAVRIGEVLQNGGIQAEIRPAQEVTDIRPYDLIVVGSAVYMGKWQRPAIDLLKRFEREISERPTWLFSSGPTGGNPAADAKVAEALAEPAAPWPPSEVARWATRIRARGHATFGGHVGAGMGGLLERWVPKGDWRKWNVIDEWASAIAASAWESSDAGVPVGPRP